MILNSKYIIEKNEQTKFKFESFFYFRSSNELADVSTSLTGGLHVNDSNIFSSRPYFSNNIFNYMDLENDIDLSYDFRNKSFTKHISDVNDRSTDQIFFINDSGILHHNYQKKNYHNNIVWNDDINSLMNSPRFEYARGNTTQDNNISLFSYYNNHFNSSEDNISSRNFTEEIWQNVSWWGIVAILVLLLTALGNILVILAISWERRLQNMTNYFLMSLAATDLMVAVLVMPFAIVELTIGE